MAYADVGIAVAKEKKNRWHAVQHNRKHEPDRMESDADSMLQDERLRSIVGRRSLLKVNSFGRSFSASCCIPETPLSFVAMNNTNRKIDF